MKLVTPIEDLDLQKYVKNLDEDMKKSIVINALRQKKNDHEILEKLHDQFW